jgi:hypothetical protein
MTDQTKKDVTTNSATDNGRPKSFSRRALIKGGVTAMPAILTLQSGAALARSSNLISEMATESAEFAATHTHCVDKGSVIQDFGDGTYDLGTTRSAHVTNIANDNTYYLSKGQNDPVSPRAMCEMGTSATKDGVFYWKEGDLWVSSDLNSGNQGFVVSAGAYSSFAFDVSKSFIE